MKVLDWIFSILTPADIKKSGTAFDLPTGAESGSVTISSKVYDFGIK